MNLKTVIPTRGLVHARTIESLRANGITDFEVIRGLPLPESHNEAVRRTLTDYLEWVLFIEDDIEIPPGTIERMIKVQSPIVVVPYPMDNGYSTVCKKDGEVLWAGLGCTLIKQSVFRAVPAPWFEIDHSWRIEEPFALTRIENPNKYGGHDINFFMKCREYGFTASCLEGIEAKHLRVKSLERQDRTQSGSYEVYELEPIKYQQNY